MTNPHDTRIAARLADYRNRVEESANIERVDKEVFDRVRVHEAQIVAAVQRFQDDNAVHVKAADELATALRREVKFVLQEGGALTGELADRYGRLRLDAENALDRLARAESESAFHIARASDPYTAYLRIIEKYPALNPGIRVQ